MKNIIIYSLTPLFLIVGHYTNYNKINTQSSIENVTFVKSEVNNLSTSTVFQSNSREINCFRHFNPNADGRHDVNQYLLAQLNRIVYPQRLGADLGINRYVSDEDFLSKFIERTEHWFYDPARKPVKPTFNETVWNNFANACSSVLLANNSTWAELEQLYIEATGNRPPSMNNQSNSQPQLANRNINNRGATPRAGNTPTTTQTQHTLALNNTATIDHKVLAKIDQVRSNSGTTYVSNPESTTNSNAELASMENFVQKVESPQVTAFRRSIQQNTACGNAETAFRNEFDRYKAALRNYRTANIEYRKSLPKYAYFVNENKRDRQINDPECIVISTPNYVLVVFRGTDTPSLVTTKDGGLHFAEWLLTNAMLELTPFSPQRRNITGRVHNGFKSSLLTIDKKISDQVIEFGGKKKKIWVTGHSLGGGQATLMAALLQLQYNVPVHGLYTYGGPSSVGDAAFSGWLNNHFNSNNKQRFQRFEVQYDLVSQLILLAKNIPPVISGYASDYVNAGIRNHYPDITKTQYIFRKEERGLFNDAKFIEMFFNLCDHSPDHYCRKAFDLLNTTIQNQLPQKPSHPGSNIDNC